jgi:DNA-binding MarR family transcriptional regulator
MALLHPEDDASRRLTILVDPRELEVRSWVRMVRFHDRLIRRIEGQIGRHGLSLAQFDLLATLAHGEGITQQEVAARLLVSKGNVCGLIDRAGASGWVERRPDPDDRRANRIYLTIAGRSLIGEVLPEHFAFLRRVLGPVGRDGLRSLHEVLGRLEDSLDHS